jgi:tetratricopeptide (TPR) repeat protein
MGDIALKQNDLPTAIANYQRVYVAYQRYLPWVAKAYINSGDCFERLGKLPEAVKTYQEMLANEKLAAFPEADVARKRLEVLGSK